MVCQILLKKKLYTVDVIIFWLLLDMLYNSVSVFKATHQFHISSQFWLMESVPTRYLTLTIKLLHIVVSTSGFFYVLCSFLHRWIYSQKFSCFSFYFSDFIVGQKRPNEIQLTFQWVVAYFIGGPSKHFTQRSTKIFFSIQWFKWLIFPLVNFK